MKKLTTALTACLLCICMLFALTGCKTISGTYADDAGVTTYEFKGSKVEITVAVLGTKTFEGKYEIGEDDDGNATITFTFEDSDAEEYSGTFPFEKGEANGKKYVKIGLFTYYKK